MSDQLISSNGGERLKRHGDGRDAVHWRNFEFSYVTEYALTSNDIPALLDCAEQWLEDFDEDDEAAWGPVHAWRALGQLRSVDAIEPLLEMVEELDEAGDDWYLEEFPHVWGMIGEAAIDPLSRYLADDRHGEFPRCAAITGLCEMAKYHPETRDQAVDILSAELAKQRSPETEEENGHINGSILAALLELTAVESAEIIERAFAANVIDPTIAGDWGDVRNKLNVDGLGLAPDKSPGWLSLRDRMNFPSDDFLGLSRPSKPQKRKPTAEELLRREEQERKRKHAADLKAKLKKKQQRKNRKKGRKAR